MLQKLSKRYRAPRARKLNNEIRKEEISPRACRLNKRRRRKERLSFPKPKIKERKEDSL